MHRKITRRALLRYVGLGVASTALLAACQPAPTPTPPPAQAAPPAAATKPTEAKVASPAPQKEVTLRWGRHVNAAEEPVYKFTEQSWAEKNPKVKLVVEEVPWADYFQKLLTQTAGGSAPDVFWLGSLYIPQFWAKGAIKSLSPFLDADKDIKLADFWERWMRYMSFRGSLFLLPVRGATFSIFYNKKLFDEAKVPYPTDSWTYENEFLEVSKKLTLKDGDKTKQWGCYVNGMGQDLWFNLFPTFDAAILSEDNCKCVLDQANAISCYQWMADLALKHGVNMKPGQVDTPAAELFQTGRIAMFTGGSPLRVDFKKITDFTWDVAMTPKGPKGSRGSPGWYGGSAMACKTSQPQEAWAFLKHQHSFDVQVQYTKLGGYFPMLIKAAKDPSWLTPPPEHADVWLRMAEYAAPDPFNPSWSKVRSLIVRDFPLVLDGKKPAAEVFPALKKEVDPLLAEGCEEEKKATPCA